IARARQQFNEMGLHQIESFQRGTATMGFRLTIKGILDNLRSALDFSSREVCERSGGPPPATAKVYFPVARPGDKPADFRSLVGTNMPGVLGSRDDLIDVLASFQEFSSPKDNAWLPDFATLANENKHIQLSYQTLTETPCEVGTTEQGMRLYKVK